MGYVISPRPFQGRFVIRRLGLAMFNPHIKFEMSMITCNEKKKGNTKCRNSRFEPALEGLRGNAQGSSMARWKMRCRHPISANRIFLVGVFRRVWVTLSANIWWMGTSPAIHLWTVRQTNVYNYATKNFCSRLVSTEVEMYWEKIAKSRFVQPFGELGATYTVQLWLVGKRVVDLLLALIELFSPALTVKAL